MPLYSLAIPEREYVEAHLVPPANNTSEVVFDPNQLQFPGDVEAIEPPVILPPLANGGSSITHTIGKLLTPVKATFPHDQHTIEFPIGSHVEVFTYENGTALNIDLNVNEQGMPILIPAAPAPIAPVGGRRRHRHQHATRQRRHRRNTRRRTSRRTSRHRN
jgi:hypothetical protein